MDDFKRRFNKEDTRLAKHQEFVKYVEYIKDLVARNDEETISRIVKEKEDFSRKSYIKNYKVKL
jgi:hypothetical protein